MSTNIRPTFSFIKLGKPWLGIRLLFVLLFIAALSYGANEKQTGDHPDHQVNEVDRIQQEINTNRENGAYQEQARGTLQLAHYYLGRNQIDSSGLYYDKAYHLGKTYGEEDVQLDAASSMAEIFYIRGQYEQAVSLYWEMIELRHQIRRDSQVLSSAYTKLGDSYRHLGKKDSALYLLQLSVRIKRQINDTITLTLPLNSLGLFHDKMGNTELALSYYLEAFGIAESTQDTFTIITLANNISQLYITQRNWTKAAQYAWRAMDLARVKGSYRRFNVASTMGQIKTGQGALDSAMFYYQQAIDGFKERRMTVFVAGILTQMAKVYKLREDWKSAELVLLEAIETVDGAGSDYAKINAGMALADLFLYQKLPQKALPLIKEAERYSREVNSKVLLKSIFLLQARAYSQMGAYEKAFQYQREWAALKDSLFNEQNTYLIADLEKRYQDEKSERQIAELTRDQQANQVRFQQQRLVSFSLMGGLALFGILFFFSYRNWTKKRLIARQREELAQEKMKAMENRQKLLSMEAMLEGQENERKRIARDLHDGLGSLLSTVKLLYSKKEKEKAPIGNPKNEKIADLIDTACHEVRRISHNMMPGVLSRLGLTFAMQDICEDINRTENLAVAFQALGEVSRYSEKIEVNLYRILQELMNNILKYAQAKEVLVQLTAEAHRLSLLVEDDGVGFDPDQMSIQEGLGLGSIQYRVEYLNGQMDLKSKTGEGTTVVIDIPVENN